MREKLTYVASEVRENYNSLNWWRQRVFVPYVVGTLTRLHPQYPGYDEAIRVMEEEWDNLIVLDSCRADIFEEVADFDEFDEYRSVVSLGSHSSEWHRRNFAGRKFGDTVLVSANPHATKVAGSSFHDIEPVWERDFSEGVTKPPASEMVQAAREAHERYPDKRLIVHLMQPHGLVDSTNPDDPEPYWQRYRNTVEVVLELTLELARDLPGRSVFTADHGQIHTGRMLSALGVNDHPAGLRLPGLVNVPWAVVDGQRRETVEGAVTDTASDIVDERLRDLGYTV